MKGASQKHRMREIVLAFAQGRRAQSHLAEVADGIRVLVLIKLTLMHELLEMCKCYFRLVAFPQTMALTLQGGWWWAGGYPLVVYLPMAFDLGSDLYLTLSYRSKPN